MEQKDKKSVIGISGSSIHSKSVQAMMKQIEASGATPLLLSNHEKRDPAEDLKKIDALVVLGNDGDIDPATYGAKADPHTISERSTKEGAARADYEETIMKAALDSKMPILGVCGGMQRLNVMCGGTLHQHLPTLLGHDEHEQMDFGIDPHTPVQPVIIDQGSTLSDIAGKISTVITPSRSNGPGVVMENSVHHQAVDKVGNDLRASAFAEDILPSGQRMVKAIEADPNGKFGDQFLVAVQWHPEFGASPLGEKIADRVVDEAQKFARAHNRQHDATEAVMENALSSAGKAMHIPSSNAENHLPARHGSMTEMILEQRRRQQAAGHTR